MDMDYEQVVVDLIKSFHQKYDTIPLNYIKAFVKILIEKEDLHSYIHYVDLYHENWDNLESFMSYNPVTKTINIHYDKYKKRKQEQSSLLSYFYFNCNLLHELYHVKERKVSQEENTLMANLLKLCFKRATYLEEINCTKNLVIKKKNMLILKYLNSIYTNYYPFDLSERLAYLYSYQMSSELAKYMGLKEFEVFWKLKEYEFYTFWRTHKSPTLYYLEKICSKQELKALEEEIESVQIPFEERLQLGLELTPKEFEIVLEKKIALTNSVH